MGGMGARQARQEDSQGSRERPQFWFPGSEADLPPHPAAPWGRLTGLVGEVGPQELTHRPAF